MKSTVLRIGNAVMDRTGKPFRITASDLVALSLSEKQGIDNLDYNPLPLTQKRAERFGFKEVSPNRWRLKGFYGFDLIKVINGGDWFSAVKYTDDKSYYMIVNSIMWVHHLQNLYQAYEERELKVIN
jgi:hypothetical protein